MKWILLALVAAAGACSPESRRAFSVGLLNPVSPRVAAEARRLGLEIAAQAPSGAATVSAKDENEETVADRARLRFLAAQAIVEGSSGVFFRLPSVPVGHDLLEYPEEWQAAARVARELLSMQRILQAGMPTSVSFSIPAGVEARAWTFRERRYVLLVNSSEKLVPLDEERLAPWRALFSVRSDARQILIPCGTSRCLPPSGVLWLEGRLLPEILP